MNALKYAENARDWSDRFDSDAIITQEPNTDLALPRLRRDFYAGKGARQDELGRVGQKIGNALEKGSFVAHYFRERATHLNIGGGRLEAWILLQDLTQNFLDVDRLQVKVGARDAAVSQKGPAPTDRLGWPR